VWHLFDNPAVPPGPLAVKIQTLGACGVKEEKPGVLVNTATRQAFTWGDACVENNTHVGFDEAAMLAAHAAVRDLLRTVFNLK
jgi:hypothetical protein